MNILVINCGSSSVKYQTIEIESGKALSKGKVDRLDTSKDGAHQQAISEILSQVKDDIAAVGHRVVHGGEHFHAAVHIDDKVKEAITSCIPFAPLHNPANLAGINAAMELLPDIPHVAVFDTAFHVRMPRRARTYAINAEVAQERGIRRYGFHGPSHSYVATQAAKAMGRPRNELRIISCHLGNGASVCAIEFGQSVETSMGMTPLEGLAMGTRSGDIDPGVVLMLARRIGIEQTDVFLNKKSGIAGLSLKGNDLRDIEKAADEGDDNCRLAISVFAHRVRKYIGAYAATMGGVDAIVLTGGIGENGQAMRRRILQRLDFLGVTIDEHKNSDAKVTHEDPVADISDSNARVRSFVIATNEELMIAKSTAAIVQGTREVNTPKPIPIAVSARHIHLTQESMDVLFGKGSELTVYRPISQPGQFASEQKLDLVGPRGTIKGVRVLGPLRPKNQIEISRTDEFKLGVDAPIRRSGHVDGSAPITLVGPKGRLELKEGLICARRHIHMTNADAKAYGVSHGDIVEVAIKGGPRDLTFGDVMIRVKDSYKLEMHIDTDEANAAELNKGAVGDLTYTDTEGLGALRSRKEAN